MGRVALEATPSAHTVMAVEPVARLRQVIREAAHTRDLDNLHVVDGFLHQVPLPDGFAHVLGWRLLEELVEFARVAKPGGMIVYCPGTAARQRAEDPTHETLLSRGYAFAHYEEADGLKRKYWKRARG